MVIRRIFSWIFLSLATIIQHADAFQSSPIKTIVTEPSSLSRLYLGDFFNFGIDDKKNVAESTPKVEEEPTPSPQDGAYDADDPVEKIFSFFFGEREAEPMGMKRMTKNQFPERYPATKTEWAEPVPSDDAEMASIRPLLKNTNLEERALKLAYDANKDGWNPPSFHNKVDKKGPSIVVLKTSDGLVCGGYNPKGWVSYGEARGSIAAFLFVLNGPYVKGDAPGCKLQKVGGPGLAQMDMPETGPQFSPDGLVIPLSKSSPKNARSKLGSYYERFPDGVNSLFGKSGSAKLLQFKVYQGVYEEGEFVPFTDAEPFALY